MHSFFCRYNINQVLINTHNYLEVKRNLNFMFWFI